MTGTFEQDADTPQEAEFQATQTQTGTVEAHAEPGMPQLNPESFASQLFWLTITFVVLYLLISRSALPRIHEILEKRQHRIAQDLDRAETLSHQAEEARAAYEKAQAEARLHANQLLAEAQAASEQLAKGEHATLDQTLAKKLADAEKTLREECTRIERDMAPIAEEATSLIVEKLLGRKPTEQQIKKAVKAAAS